MSDHPSDLVSRLSIPGGEAAPPLLSLLLRLLNQHYNEQVDAALRAGGFTDIRPAHANVFAFARPEGIHVTELATLARVRKQSMAQAVDQLEKLGYVERRPDPNDARARLVFLTERGAAVRPVCVAAGRRVEEHWASMVGQAELDRLRGTMQLLLDRLLHTGHSGA